MTLLVRETMDAYFYGEDEELLGYISSINKQTIDFIKENGFESDGKTYAIKSMKYNIDRGCIVFRCVLDSKTESKISEID